MKRIFCYLFAASAAVCAAETLRAQETTPTTDPGVKIGETVWATRNVGDAGKFVANPEDFGGYFTFEEAKTACPDGWRTPTWEELDKLSYTPFVWTTLNEITGGRFGTGNNTIFLPATGLYWKDTAEAMGYGKVSHYWSSTSVAADSNEVSKGIALAFTDEGFSRFSTGANASCTIRCVKK